MKQQLGLAAVIFVLAVVLTKEFWPTHVKVEKPVPTIITVHDTVKDTVRLVGPKVVTTDTVQLVIRETIHDTVQINVGPDTSARPNLWPILNAEIGKSRGDTSRVTTFNLRSGKPASSLVWTPGPLRSIWADSSGTPSMDFYEPAKQPGVSLWTKVKWLSIGFGSCYVSDRLGRK